MGTRNLTAVFQNGEYKVAQYAQWDGYPSGQGVNILKFLRTADMAKFADAVSKCIFGTEEEIEQAWISAGAEKGADSVSMEVSEKLKIANPQFSRDTGSDVLPFIVAQDGCMLHNSIGFVFDSLFCEWAYVIDLDKGVFEVYQGFNKKPLGPRARFHANNIKDTIDITQINPTKDYYPVKLKKKFKLNALPTEEEFLAKFKDGDN
jgi:hypothetical protein